MHIIMRSDMHRNKIEAIKYNAWMVILDPTNSDIPGERNIFLDSKLAVWGCNAEPIDWIPESAYRVPTGGRDSTPLSQDGCRRDNSMQTVRACHIDCTSIASYPRFN